MDFLMQHDQHHQHDDQLVHELGGSSTSSHHLQHSEESASEHKPKNDVRGAARCWAFLVQFYHRNLGNVHSLLLLSVMLVYVVPVFIWALLHRLDCVIEPSCEDATALGWRHMFDAAYGYSELFFFLWLVSVIDMLPQNQHYLYALLGTMDTHSAFEQSIQLESERPPLAESSLHTTDLVDNRANFDRIASLQNNENAESTAVGELLLVSTVSTMRQDDTLSPICVPSGDQMRPARVRLLQKEDADGLLVHIAYTGEAEPVELNLSDFLDPQKLNMLQLPSWVAALFVHRSAGCVLAQLLHFILAAGVMPLCVGDDELSVVRTAPVVIGLVALPGAIMWYRRMDLPLPTRSCFILRPRSTHKGCYCFRARSEADRDRWIDAIAAGTSNGVLGVSADFLERYIRQHRPLLDRSNGSSSYSASSIQTQVENTANTTTATVVCDPIQGILATTRDANCCYIDAGRLGKLAPMQWQVGARPRVLLTNFTHTTVDLAQVAAYEGAAPGAAKKPAIPIPLLGVLLIGSILLGVGIGVGAGLAAIAAIVAVSGRLVPTRLDMIAGRGVKVQLRVGLDPVMGKEQTFDLFFASDDPALRYDGWEELTGVWLPAVVTAVRDSDDSAVARHVIRNRGDERNLKTHPILSLTVEYVLRVPGGEFQVVEIIPGDSPRLEAICTESDGSFGPATTYVSHAWQEEFEPMIEALRAKGKTEDVISILFPNPPWSQGGQLLSSSRPFLDTVTPREPYYYLDIFARNLHLVHESMEDLNDAIVGAGKLTLYCARQHPVPLCFKRIWCLYEVFQGNRLLGSIGIACPAARQEHVTTFLADPEIRARYTTLRTVAKWIEDTYFAVKYASKITFGFEIVWPQEYTPGCIELATLLMTHFDHSIAVTAQSSKTEAIAINIKTADAHHPQDKAKLIAAAQSVCDDGPSELNSALRVAIDGAQERAAEEAKQAGMRFFATFTNVAAFSFARSGTLAVMLGTAACCTIIAGYTHLLEPRLSGVNAPSNTMLASGASLMLLGMVVLFATINIFVGLKRRMKKLGWQKAHRTYARYFDVD